MSGKALVIDANILIRAVLGQRVREVIEANCERSTFFVPAAAYQEAQEHLPALFLRRGKEPETALALLHALAGAVEIVGEEAYAEFEIEARERLGARDPEDWPILATALSLNCPIWTEDSDFFGCGVATWTTSRVQLFLRSAR